MKLSDDKPRYVSEIRCKKCKRLLMKGHIRDIEIKCPKCGYADNS